MRQFLLLKQELPKSTSLLGPVCGVCEIPDANCKVQSRVVWMSWLWELLVALLIFCQKPQGLDTSLRVLFPTFLPFMC